MKIKICTVEEIENYEANLNTYEFDAANTTSIFQLDTRLINNQPHLFAKREEYRRQRWSVYLKHCPTKKMQKLKEKINKNRLILKNRFQFCTFAIAKLHRKISTELREGAN